MSKSDPTRTSYLIPPTLEPLISETRATIHVGFPLWLRLVTARDVVAITLGKRVYLRSDMVSRPPEKLARLLRHELAHVRQVNRLGVVMFLWRYVTEFLVHFWRERSIARAYRSISFEIEANAEEERADV